MSLAFVYQVNGDWLGVFVEFKERQDKNLKDPRYFPGIFENAI